MENEIKEVVENTKLYVNNPFYFTMYTYIEIFPVGVLVSLISALILRRKANTESLIS